MAGALESTGIETGRLVLYLLPVILLQLGLMIYALVDLARRDAVRFDSRLLWALVIIFINLLGPIVYLAWGRTPAGKAAWEEEDEP